MEAIVYPEVEKDTNQTTQANVRINQQLKHDGDAALAAAGFTSSKAIRTLYQFAAEHADQPELIAQRLKNLSETGRTKEQERRECGLAAIERGKGIFTEALHHLDIANPDPNIANMPIDQLKEQAFAEKYGTGARA